MCDTPPPSAGKQFYWARCLFGGASHLPERASVVNQAWTGYTRRFTLSSSFGKRTSPADAGARPSVCVRFAGAARRSLATARSRCSMARTCSTACTAQLLIMFRSLCFQLDTQLFVAFEASPSPGPRFNDENKGTLLTPPVWSFHFRFHQKRIKRDALATDSISFIRPFISMYTCIRDVIFLGFVLLL